MRLVSYLASPLRFLSDLSDSVVILHTSVSFHCHADNDGTSEIDVRWSVDDAEINNSSEHRILNNGTLRYPRISFPGVVVSSSSVYRLRCRASDVSGSIISREAKVEFACKLVVGWSVVCGFRLLGWVGLLCVVVVCCCVWLLSVVVCGCCVLLLCVVVCCCLFVLLFVVCCVLLSCCLVCCCVVVCGCCVSLLCCCVWLLCVVACGCEVVMWLGLCVVYCWLCLVVCGCV